MNAKRDEYVELFDQVLIGMRAVKRRGQGVIESHENRQADQVLGAWIEGVEALRSRYMSLLAAVTEHDQAVKRTGHRCKVIEEESKR